MATDSRNSGSHSDQGLAARAAMLDRVQDQLSARRPFEPRRCPLCGDPIRGGQPRTTLHGTAVHERCRRISR